MALQRVFTPLIRPLIPRSVITLAPPRPTARSRLSLISRHLDQRPDLPLNTPFSTERLAGREDGIPYTPLERAPPKQDDDDDKKPLKMSSQAEHPALMIPGPIEFDDAVLQSMGHFSFVSLLPVALPPFAPFSVYERRH